MGRETIRPKIFRLREKASWLWSRAHGDALCETGPSDGRLAGGSESLCDQLPITPSSTDFARRNVSLHRISHANGFFVVVARSAPVVIKVQCYRN